MAINRSVRERRKDILSVAALHGASNVRVFGSAARGEAGVQSDLDLLVDMEQGRSLLDLVALCQDLEDMLGCRVDVLTEDGISPYLREQICGQAVRL
jgi:uncharacterized protein